MRAKPDITAAAGVSTTLPPGSGLNPFYGTSAAAPHAGAIAGLLKSANPALTPAQIRTFLTTTAVDVESAGYDNISGFGIVQAFQAMQAVSPTPLATLLLGTVTAAEGAFSNGNGFIDPGEVGTLVIQLTNPSITGATAVQATLSTATPGVTITQASASYGTIAGTTSATNAATPYVLVVDSSVVCGTQIAMSLNVTFGGGTSPLVFPFTVVVGKPQAPISSTLGAVPPSGPGFTSTSGQQTGRISRTGVASSCAAPKANPGLTAATGRAVRRLHVHELEREHAVRDRHAQLDERHPSTRRPTRRRLRARTEHELPGRPRLVEPVQTYSSASPRERLHDGRSRHQRPSDVRLVYYADGRLAACSSGLACTPVTITTPARAGFFGRRTRSRSRPRAGAAPSAGPVTGALPTGVTPHGQHAVRDADADRDFPITVTRRHRRLPGRREGLHGLDRVVPAAAALVMTAPVLRRAGIAGTASRASRTSSARRTRGPSRRTITSGQDEPDHVHGGRGRTPLPSVNATVGPAVRRRLRDRDRPARGLGDPALRLPPCRIVDTRNPNGTARRPGDRRRPPDRTFTLTGTCGIPPGALASSRITVVGRRRRASCSSTAETDPCPDQHGQLRSGADARATRSCGSRWTVPER